MVGIFVVVPVYILVPNVVKDSADFVLLEFVTVVVNLFVKVVQESVTIVKRCIAKIV